MRRSWSVVAVALAASVLALCAAVWVTSTVVPEQEVTELVSSRTEHWFAPLAPVHSADRLLIYWGEGVDHFDSARVVHTTLSLNHAPEYITSLESQRFRGLSLSCCSVVVFPPFAHGFPVFGPDSNIARRISRFVAQGNTAIVTGGVTDLLFLNSYFKLQLEPVTGAYSAGPFVRRYSRVPAVLKNVNLPSKLRQVNIQATGVSIASLPYGSVVLYDDMQAATPVFALKYCMINNPKSGEPPLKVQPASCKRWKKKGFPCGCGNIIYIGFDYKDTQEADWNSLLRNIVEWAQMPPKPPAQKGAKGAASSSTTTTKHK